jgi:hypothetical protein
MNTAYASVDGEASYLYRIRNNLEIRASRSATNALMGFEGALSVIHAGKKIVVVRGPEKHRCLSNVPSFERETTNIFFDNLVGARYKGDAYSGGDKAIPQSTNPLTQYPDHVIAESGTWAIS